VRAHGRGPRAPTSSLVVGVGSVVALLAMVGCAGDDDGAELGEDRRPLLHFTPAEHWMNDPNGPLFHRGEYHLFFQYNPEGDTWGNIGWGQAISTDLFDWEQLGVAIPASGDTLVFSGSAVVDPDTSGLCAAEECLVAVYTAHTVDPETRSFDQTQNLAVSDDDGRTWRPYEGNPVLDVDLVEFRDPNVSWHEPTGHWIMSVAASLDRTIRFYRSPDLRTWELASEFGPLGVTEGVWECPVLQRLPVEGSPGEFAWVLKVDHNPGHVTGGSGAQYFVGDFDGFTFSVDRPELSPRWVDHGPDYYCAMQFSNEPGLGPRTWIAWMSNWEYASDVPALPWRGSMTLPQSVSLRRVGDVLELARVPVATMQERRGVHHRFEAAAPDVVDAALRDVGVRGRALELMAVIEPGGAAEVGLSVLVGEGEETVVAYDAAAQELVVDRTRSGAVDFHPAFPAAHRAALPLEDGRVTVRIVIDRTSVEVFAADGRVTLSSLVFPGARSDGLAVYALGGGEPRLGLDVWELGG
jgi:fructan beta-fructosidase